MAACEDALSDANLTFNSEDLKLKTVGFKLWFNFMNNNNDYIIYFFLF